MLFRSVDRLDLRSSYELSGSHVIKRHTVQTLATETLTCIGKHKTTTFVDVQKGMLITNIHMGHILGYLFSFQIA